MYNPYNYNPGIIWVNGSEGAKAYQIAPGSNAMLLDSENEGIFYIKVSDNVGMCTIRTFKYEEVTSKKENNYVQKEELQMELEKLRKEFSNGKQLVPPAQQRLDI